MIPRDDITIGNLTHVGRERSENQDYYGYYEPEDDREFELKGRLIVVCDGMGGHAGGEIASRLAVSAILEAYRNDQTGNVMEALRLSIEKANRSVWDKAATDPKLQGMGSTCISMVLKKGMAYFGHVGDSRAYYLRNGDLHQATKDHSLVQQLVDEGLLAKEEMENHPDKNVILRSLGVKPTVEVEIGYQPIEPGDAFLLCTDGLSGLVGFEEIRRVLMEFSDEPMAACSRLVDLANMAGGYDNITVQIVKVTRVEGTNIETHRTSTQAFSVGDVQKAIEQARTESRKGGGSGSAAAVAAPPVKAPSAAPAGPPAGAPSAPEKARVAPQRAGFGGGLLALVGVAALLLGVVVGAVVASRSSASGAMRDLAAARAEAAAAGAERSAASQFQAAEEAEGRAWNAFDGLLGALRSGPQFEQAARAYREAASSAHSTPSGSEGALDAVRETAEAARRFADSVNASRDAGEQYNQATRYVGEATRLAGEGDADGACRSFAGACRLFREAGAAALQRQYERTLAEVREVEQEARAAHVEEVLPNLFQAARDLIGAAEAAAREPPDGDRILGYQRALSSLERSRDYFRQAIPAASEVQKSRVARLARRAEVARETARTAGAEQRAATPWGEATRAMDDARRASENERHTDAIDRYRQAIDYYETCLREMSRSDLMSVVIARRDAAHRAQGQAIQVGAPELAPQEMEQGEAAISRGEIALSGDRFQEADAAFVEAIRQFGSALQAAQASVRSSATDARSQAAQAKTLADGIRGVATIAQVPYGEANDRMQAGDQAMERGDYRAAADLFAEARARFDAAREAANARLNDPMRSEAEAARTRMEAARTQARGRPSNNATYQTIMGRAARAEGEGATLLERGDWAAAKQKFLEAEAAYNQAARISR